MATENELIDFVLDNFQGIGSGQAANPEDVEKVRPYIPGALADLAARNVIYIPDGDSVPDAAIHWVAALIAHAPGLQRHFGEPQNLPTVEYCTARLLQQKPAQSFSTLKVDYF